MILFTIIFALLIDLDFIIRIFVLKQKKGDRTIVQEPFGLLFIGLPLAILLTYTLKQYYFFLVLIPYASHIFLDYITLHKVFALTPFSKKKFKVGFITPMIADARKVNLKTIFKLKGFHEHYILLINILIFITLQIII